METTIISLKRLDKIFKKYLIINDKNKYRVIEREHLEKLQKSLCKNISNNIGLLDIDKYIKEFTDIENIVDCINIKDFIIELKEFFKTKEFKDLQKLEEISWHHKLEELYKKLVNLTPLSNNLDLYLKNEIETLKTFLETTLYENYELSCNKNYGSIIFYSLKNIIDCVLIFEENKINLEEKIIDLKDFLLIIFKKLISLENLTYKKDKF